MNCINSKQPRLKEVKKMIDVENFPKLVELYEQENGLLIGEKTDVKQGMYYPPGTLVVYAQPSYQGEALVFLPGIVLAVKGYWNKDNYSIYHQVIVLNNESPAGYVKKQLGGNELLPVRLCLSVLFPSVV